MKFTISKLLLIIILGIAFVLRIYQVADMPPGMTWDEAALGYNAYSILKTARDEHRAFLPLTFKSFGDYKPGAYVYAAVPFVALFGLNEVSTRLPSILAGVLAVWGIYLLTNLLFSNELKIGNWNLKIGLLPALLLSLSPWHIYFSRGAWEVNLYTTLTIFNLYYFTRFLTQNRSLSPSIILSLISLYTYQAAKLLTPLLLFVTLCFYLPSFYKIIKKWRSYPHYLDYFTLAAGIIVGLFLLYQNVFGASGNRLTHLSFFNYRPPQQQDGSVFHNYPDFLSRSLVSRYIYHFSPEVLFYEGPVITVRGHIPRLGMLYLADAVLLILGLSFISRTFTHSSSKLVLALALVSPIPASLTLAEFSTFRAEFLVIPLTLISAIGLTQIIKNIPPPKLGGGAGLPASRQGVVSLISLFFILIYICNTLYGLDLYFNHSKNEIAWEYNSGYKQAITAVTDWPAEKVYISDVYGQPYIFYLFYTRYDPAKYQAHNDFVDGGTDVGWVGRIDNIEFHQFSSTEIKHNKNTLFIGAQGSIPDGFDYHTDNIEYYEQIDFAPNKPMFRVVKTR